ncbi:hypothetical protein ACQQ2Q_10290 [Agrobacterium sp. ES01]|uniref:hypothetical protein n=1 Tax=Agrobacterium sp. ES01 TaxID=3420714 RepID=UPI003D0B4552
MPESGKTGAPSVRTRLSASRPPALIWIVGALVWGAALTGALLVTLAILERLGEFHLTALVSIYFCGGALAWLIALPLIRFASYRRRVETRFAAGFLFLGLGTVAMTAFLFAMQYRLFYSRWHAPAGSFIWMYQFVYTSAGAAYEFCVIGVRLVFPWAPALLLAASLYLARQRA